MVQFFFMTELCMLGPVEAFRLVWLGILLEGHTEWNSKEHLMQIVLCVINSYSVQSSQQDNNIRVRPRSAAISRVADLGMLLILCMLERLQLV